MTLIIEKMIRSTNELFRAIQAAGNEAHKSAGYNEPFEFTPGLTAAYELYDKGPAQLHYSQYACLNDKELGSVINPEKDGLSEDALFWAMEEVYRRITITEGTKAVCRIEGKRELKMSLHEKGPWEERLMEWYRTDGLS
jgi:hypothetical protein